MVESYGVIIADKGRKVERLDVNTTMRVSNQVTQVRAGTLLFVEYLTKLVGIKYEGFSRL